MTDPTVSLTARLDRQLAWSGGNSIRHLLIEVGAEAGSRARHRSRPLNVALVVDTSGSMAGGKLDAAKAAVAEVIRQLRDDDTLSLVSFDSEVRVHLDGVRLSSGRRRALAAATGLETGSCTCLSGGWLQGAECAARAMVSGTSAHIVLLSDGLANEGITDVPTLAHHAAELFRRGLATSTVGIGDDYDANLLQAMAREGGGRMHDAEHPQEIAEVLLAELREQQTALVQDVVLTVTVPATVRAEVVGAWAAEPVGASLRVALGSLATGRSRQVVIRLTCPAGDPDEILLLAVATVATVATGREGEIGLTAEAEVELLLAASAENNRQPLNTDVADVVAGTWQGEIVRRVADLNRDGERRASRAYLERELRYFERYVRPLAEGKRLLAELLAVKARIDEAWSERTRKEMQLHGFKRSRGEEDFRASAPRNWAADFLPDHGSAGPR